MLPVDIFLVYFNGDLVGIFLDTAYSISNDNLHNAVSNVFASMGFRSLNDYTKHLPSYKKSGQKFIEYRDEGSNYYRYVNTNKKTHEVTFNFWVLHHSDYWGSNEALSITNQINKLFKDQFDHLNGSFNYDNLSCPFLITPILQDFVNCGWAEVDDVNSLWFCKDWYESWDIKRLMQDIKKDSDDIEIAKSIQLIKKEVKSYVDSYINKYNSDLENLTEHEIDDMFDETFGI